MVHVARPGILIGSKGANLDALERYLVDLHVVPEQARIRIVEERIMEFLESFVIAASYDETDYD